MSDDDATPALAGLDGAVALGDGRIGRGRHGAVVLGHDGDAALTAEIVALVAGTTDDDSGPPDGRALVWAVASRLADGGSNPPSLALVADVDGAVAVLVAGDAEVVVRRRDDGPLSFAGHESVTWVDRIVTDAVDTIELGAPDASVAADGPSLGAGVIDGDRLRLSPASADEGASAPGSGGAPSVGVPVTGVLCENGHFNHPLARYCRIDGVAMTDGGRRVEQERPALGVFVRGDGTTFTLEADSVLGRDPAGAGDGRPVLQLDHDTVAPVHAAVLLVGWDVTLRDLGTGHATWHWPLGGEAQRIPAGGSVTLGGGDRVAIGHYELRFESHHL